MTRIFILLVLVSSSAHAATYLELGIGWQDKRSCITDWKEDAGKYGCSSNPLGSIALGYEYKGFSFEVEHSSSLPDYDYGINVFAIKYRYTFK